MIQNKHEIKEHTPYERVQSKFRNRAHTIVGISLEQIYLAMFLGWINKSICDILHTSTQKLIVNSDFLIREKL